jgi:Ca-activated chloride channel family protein
VRFLWPEALALALLRPQAVLAYRLLLRRRGAAALRVGSLALIRAAMDGRPSWRRHVPPALLLVGITVALLAVGRPVAVFTLPSNDRTVILAIDASGSMRATDVAPSRIEAARAAARVFVERLPPTTKVGLVTFAATASVAQAPTVARDEVLAALERLPLQRGTAAGSAIAVSLQLLFPDLDVDLAAPDLKRRPRDGDPSAAPRPSPAAPPAAEPGSYPKATIVLLSDGQSNVGPDPQLAARLAAERGVRVHTVAVGTPQGETLSVEGWSMRVRLDETALRGVADITRGTHFSTASGEQLRAAYDALAARVAFETREMEIGGPLLGLAALLMVLAGALSRWWLGRFG